MKPPELKPRLTALALAFALVLVLNPEVRTFLLLLQFTGLEVFTFILLIQLRSFTELMSVFFNKWSSKICLRSREAIHKALHLAVGMLWSKQGMAQSINIVSNGLYFVRCSRAEFSKSH